MAKLHRSTAEAHVPASALLENTQLRGGANLGKGLDARANCRRMKRAKYRTEGGHYGNCC